MFLLGITGIVWLMSVPGSYCETFQSPVKYTWEDANAFCADNAANLVSADTAVRSNLHTEVVIWTSSTGIITKQTQIYCDPLARLCGIRFINQESRRSTLYVNCNVPHFYVCKDGEGMQLQRRNATYDEAMKCKYTPTINDTLSLQPGYYWTKSIWAYCTQQSPLGALNVTHDTSKGYCGVYGEGLGLAFGKCSETHYALCTSASTVSLHSTTEIRHISVELTHPTKHQQRTTDAAHSSLVASTDSLHSATSNGIRHISVETTYPIKQQGATDAADSGLTGIGVKIGVPVGVCAVLICGTIVVMVYVCRRRRQKPRNEETDTTGNGNSKMCVNGMYALQTSVPERHSEPKQSVGKIVRVSYNKTQEQPETNEYEYLDESEIRHLNREQVNVGRNIHNKALNSSAVDLDSTVDCFADYDGNQTSNDCENPDDHVYNHANEDGEYDTIATKHQAKVKPDDVYNHMSHTTDIENDYDSTIPGKLPKHQQTSNVYNTFSGGLCDETNDYDYTDSMVDTKGAEIGDNTYNTLYTE